MDLGFIDEHRRSIDAPPEAIYAAVTDTVADAFSGRLAFLYGGLVRCRPRGSAEPGRVEMGSELVGASIVRAEPPRRLVLTGSHHFAAYRLDFAVVSSERGPVVVARTDAAFPGVRGRLYRAIVIGSRLHARVVRRMLGAIALRAAAHA